MSLHIFTESTVPCRTLAGLDSLQGAADRDCWCRRPSLGIMEATGLPLWSCVGPWDGHIKGVTPTGLIIGWDQTRSYDSVTAGYCHTKHNIHLHHLQASMNSGTHFPTPRMTELLLGQSRHMFEFFVTYQVKPVHR